MNGSSEIFDRRLLRRRRDRAAAAFGDHEFLWREVAVRLAERLEEVTRTFPRALDLGCHQGGLRGVLGSRGGIEDLVQCDLSEGFVRQAWAAGGMALAADEELLPFRQSSFDLVLSAFTLHGVNDLPGCLLQVNRILRPDGLFLGAFLGGESLSQLREALMLAEVELAGGASPRVAPFVDLREAGALLQRAGFAMPVADLDSITVDYGEPLRLLADLRGMAAANALTSRKSGGLGRSTLFRALEIYREKHGRPDGRVAARFDIVFLTGWAPAASQPQPLRPGSASRRLAEALETEELPAGDKALPGKTDS